MQAHFPPFDTVDEPRQLGLPLGKPSGSYKNDQTKADHSLISPFFKQDMAAALTDGAKKYGRTNWLTPGLNYSRVMAAAQRHLTAWEGGETNDPESGVPHLAHAACCLMMLHEYDRRGLRRSELDDRHF